MSAQPYYVYVYIDPRTLQEFYYGKGFGDRKLAHLKDDKDTEKVRLIREIKAQNLEPIIKVIARGLTEEQAHLIEEALIWKLGRTLTNKVSGHFSKNFRPHFTMHQDLYEFDYENGVYCINIGEGPHRCWEDSWKYNFISAGQDWKKWGSRISILRPNDILCAYLSRYGYVGIARVLERARPASEFIHNGKSLSTYPLKQPRILDIKESTRDGEFVTKVEWIVARDRTEAIGGDRSVWRARSMLGSLEDQPKTLKFLEQNFGVSFPMLLKTT